MLCVRIPLFLTLLRLNIDLALSKNNLFQQFCSVLYFCRQISLSVIYQSAAKKECRSQVVTGRCCDHYRPDTFGRYYKVNGLRAKYYRVETDYGYPAAAQRKRMADCL